MRFGVRAVDEEFRLEALADERPCMSTYGDDHGIDRAGGHRLLQVVEAEIPGMMSPNRIQVFIRFSMNTLNGSDA